MVKSRFLAVLGAAVLAVAAYAAFSPVGTWKGSISIDKTKLPKAQNAQQQKQLDASVAEAKKAKMSITFKADKTFSASAEFPGQKKQVASGTWSVSGQNLTLTTTKEDGKAVKKKQPQVLTVAKDNKSFGFSPTPGVTITFKK